MADPVITRPVDGERHRIEPCDKGAVIVRLADGARIGTLAFETRGDVVDLRAVCVDEAARGYGAGTEAVRLLLQSAKGIRRIDAYAPPDQGLPVYFWCRMGFRPLFGATENGGIRFQRGLT